MHRKNRRGLKKIGLLALALVIALGAMGVGYAAWTDELYIEGTVNTGTVDIDINGVSSTFVYKVPGAPDTGYGPETVVHYPENYFDPSPPTDPGTELIASAATRNMTHNDQDEATMDFIGLFPCIDFIADLELKYRGTIPGKINVAIINPTRPQDAILLDLWEMGEDTKGQTPRMGAWIDGQLSTDDGTSWVEIDDPLGLQLHRNDLVHVALHVHLPQDDAYQNLTDLQFTGLVTVVQWNEYPYTPP